jgi:DNA-directed RNA polymerase specialized sigma54-like protein
MPLAIAVMTTPALSLTSSKPDQAMNTSQLQERIALLERQVEDLKSVIHDEIAANLAFRDQVHAKPDEDMPTLCARIVRDLRGAGLLA